jgi:two-component system, NarL family, vancomycin resistance associated response regulator VraR
MFDTTTNEQPHPSCAVMAKTILIADDHDAVRRAICEAFTIEDDFEVCGEAHDGHDAIEKAQQLHPDLIILDLSMSVMNGFEAARALRDLMPSVPIIMFTLYADGFMKEKARLAGVADVVSKSDDISVLTQTARRLLHREAA